MNTASNNDLLERLQQHEEAVAEIYATFGDRIPCMADFWSNLVNEEKSHAMVINMIRKAIGNANLSLDTRKFNMTAVQTAIDFIRRQTEQIRVQGTTTVKALFLAINLEQAMIERDFFCIFETDSPDMKREFSALREHTLKHQRMLERMLEREKDKPSK
ncbi:MAG TPA: hypothetical protein DCS43_09150 [Verrucomicrobia bacterium]|nr:hypothetical protein [Verrucomicrobiota bacterium]